MSSSRNEVLLSLSTSARSNQHLGVRLLEGAFSITTSKFSSMSVYVKVQYGDQIWKSSPSIRQGQRPQWNLFHSFDFCSASEIDFTFYDKGIFSDTELGSIKPTISEISQNHQTEWWSILNSSKQLVGSVLVTFELPQDENLITTHSTHNSLEFRDEFLKQSAEIELEKESLHAQWASYRREKSRNKSGLQDECIDKLKLDLSRENERLKEKESNLKVLFEQAKKEGAKLKKAKAELKRSRENLKRREQSLQIEEQAILHEKVKLGKERDEIQAMKSQLSHDSAKLKQERQKLLTEKREIENLSKELGQASRKITKEKVLLKKSSLSTKALQDIADDDGLKVVYEDLVLEIVDQPSK
jgi:hypothetical protein